MSRQEELFLIRQSFMARQQDALLRNVSAIERKLYDELIGKLIASIKLATGPTIPENFGLAAQVDQIFDKFESSNHYGNINRMVDDFSKMASMNDDYYRLFNAPREKYVKIRKDARDFMRQTLGLDAKNNMVSKGYLDQLIRDQRVRQKAKELTFRSTIEGQDLVDLQEGLREIIVSTDDKDSELMRYYKGFAYDAYQKFDRIHNKVFATELNLRAAIYAGGLIETSRVFCEKRNNKVFTVEEMLTWKDDPDLPKTKNERESGTVTNYVGSIDCGRWKCRHIMRWISRNLAEKMRPELKEYFGRVEQSVILMTKAEDAAPVVDKVSQRIAKKHKGTVTPINMKSQDSILRKAVNEYGGNVGNIKDAVRNTIVVDSSKIPGVLNDLEQAGIVDRIKEQTPDKFMGYSGTIVNVKLSNGLLGEIQVNTPKMIYAKMSLKSALNILGKQVYDAIHEETGLEGGLGHSYYEEYRILNPATDSKRMAELEALSQAYYSRFR